MTTQKGRRMRRPYIRYGELCPPELGYSPAQRSCATVYYLLPTLYWFFLLHLIQREQRFAFQALGVLLVGHHQGAAAVGTWRRQRPLPGSELAGRVIGAAEEHAAPARAALHQFAAIQRAGHADLLQPRLGVAGFRGSLAAGEFSV